jgi:hypothetical protein
VGSPIQQQASASPNASWTSALDATEDHSSRKKIGVTTAAARRSGQASQVCWGVSLVGLFIGQLQCVVLRRLFASLKGAALEAAIST